MFFAEKKERPGFFKRLKRKVITLALAVLVAWGAYYYYWGQHLYTITAYCDCPICINVAEHHDHHFASGKKVYWGGVATDPSIPFGSSIFLLPHWPSDWLALFELLGGRQDFIAEDRGGKIKGRDVDLFIPDFLGAHETAKKWGVRKMRIKINGELAK